MDIHFTERELDIMRVLWQHGPCTVEQVRKRLPDALAYTTVLTMLQTMEGKGHVCHRPAGRAYRYHALVEQGPARRSALRRLTDQLFGGSRELLWANLVADETLSDDELGRLRALLDARAEKK